MSGFGEEEVDNRPMTFGRPGETKYGSEKSEKMYRFKDRIDQSDERIRRLNMFAKQERAKREGRA